jgi:hypothetical protein
VWSISFELFTLRFFVKLEASSFFGRFLNAWQPLSTNRAHVGDEGKNGNPGRYDESTHSPPQLFPPLSRRAGADPGIPEVGILSIPSRRRSIQSGVGDGSVPSAYLLDNLA